MNRRFFNVLLLTSTLTGVICLNTAAETNAVPTTSAASKTNAVSAKKADKAEKKAKEGAKEGAKYSFHGTVASTDKKAMSVTLEGKEHQRVLGLNAESHLEKGGKPATLADLAAGDYLHGTVEKKDKLEVIVKATAGPKPEKKAEKAKKKTADQ